MKQIRITNKFNQLQKEALTEALNKLLSHRTILRYDIDSKSMIYSIILDVKKLEYISENDELKTL